MRSWSEATPCRPKAARPTRLGSAVALVLLGTSACGGGGTETADYCIVIGAGDPANPDCPTRAAMSAHLVGTDVGGEVVSVDSEPARAVLSDPRLISCCYRITREKSR